MSNLNKFLEKSKEISSKATAGKWIIDEDIWAIQIEGGGKNHYPVTWASSSKKHRLDAEFIAHARNSHDILIQIIETLRDALTKIEDLTPLNERARREISRETLQKCNEIAGGE